MLSRPRFQPLTLILKQNKLSTVLVRQNHIWTSDRIVKSPCKDIEIPKTTLVNYVWRNLDKWASKTATVCGVTNRSYTYAELYERSRHLGSNLRLSLGIQNGDAVAIMLPNLPEYPIATFGILSAGGVVTTLNPLYTAHEVQRQLHLSEAKAVITTPEILPTIKQALAQLNKSIPLITVTGSAALEGVLSFDELTGGKSVNLGVLDEVKREASDVCYLPYSSGTTGLPKGVELMNSNIVANCEQQNVLRQYLPTTETYQDTTLAVLPMFHCYALSMIMTHKLSAGLKIVTLPRFEPKTYLNALLQHKVNVLFVAPPIVLFLGSNPEVGAQHFEHVHTVLCGAAPLPHADIEKMFQKAGRELNFVQAYGLTETSPLATVSPNGSRNYFAAGVALPNVHLRIVDQNFNNKGPNEVGELLIKGPNVMKGYKNNPEANEGAFADGDWFRSGDMAKIDEEGYVTITDRLKELIKVKGFQVPPAELEFVLKEHPGVLDAAVVGIPDPKTGERPKAFIVPREGVKLKEEEIVEFVKDKVAPYKRIKDITFVDSLPKNPSGKILRRILREKYC